MRGDFDWIRALVIGLLFILIMNGDTIVFEYGEDTTVQDAIRDRECTLYTTAHSQEVWLCAKDAK